ncbi:MAG: alpha/beta hydrolase [Gemmatimonadota bacterium]|nr:MAG: alpha/beta hydrolase [Gemmatimonadota bacterium]
MKSTRANLIVVAGLAAALISCSDPVSVGGIIKGGLENPASDGSYTQAINSENGIAALEPVVLGGVEQWILIRGYDVTNPVLIYLHGGPGSPAIPYGRFAFSGLEQDFTVVTWDQRGCGKSYSPTIDVQSITLEQLLSDTRQLIVMMRGRFESDVYLMGASWGSVLGILTARDDPDLLSAYVGVGQFINAERTMRLASAIALKKATELGIQEAIDELSTIQLHPEIEWDRWKDVVPWLEAFGFGDLHDTSLYSALIDTLRAATEYTAQDFANQNEWEQLYWASPLNADLGWVHGLDISSQVMLLDVPILFLAGRFDYKTPGELVEEYLNVLEAPAGKQMMWFENSAHALFFEEREAFSSVIRNTVR